MPVTLEELKLEMRMDTDDADSILENKIKSATSMVKDMLRVTAFTEFNEEQIAQIKTAVIYAASYLYDYPENKNHTNLEINLRSLLANIREVKF